MTNVSIDLQATLEEIRTQAVAIAKDHWNGLGDLVDDTLPKSISPKVLIPVITGKACQGDMKQIVKASAATLLINLAFRFADDCADEDNKNALYLKVGVGAAFNYAMALNACGMQALFELGKHTSAQIPKVYFHAFIQVCQGQDRDIRSNARTLKAYKDIVQLKSVVTYEFAAGIGAWISTNNQEIAERCVQCGTQLAWMEQIINDIAALWFPNMNNLREVEKGTFPVLTALEMDHPNAVILKYMYETEQYDRKRICELLDGMNMRNILMNQALDHRDAAIAALGQPLNPQGHAILQVFLDWMLSSAEKLLVPLEGA